MMKFDTQTAANYAGQKLDSLLERATRDCGEVVNTNSIPDVATFFSELQQTAKNLAAKVTEVQKLVDTLSHEVLPTMFLNQRVNKTYHVEGLGNVTVSDRWDGSIIKGQKEAGLDWLRATGNEGLITETVNSQTLGAFAKREAEEKKRPLPDDIFKISSKPYTRIGDRPAEGYGK